MVRITFRIKFVAIAERLWTFFQQVVGSLSSLVDELACDADTSLHSGVAPRQSTVRKRLVRLAVESDAQDGPNDSQGGPPSGSLNPNSRS